MCSPIADIRSRSRRYCCCTIIGSTQPQPPPTNARSWQQLPQLIQHRLLGGDMSIGLYNTAAGNPPCPTTAEATRLLLRQLPLATYYACSGALPLNRFHPAHYGSSMYDIKKLRSANVPREAARLLPTPPAAETTAIAATRMRSNNHGTQYTSHRYSETI